MCSTFDKYSTHKPIFEIINRRGHIVVDFINSYFTEITPVSVKLSYFDVIKNSVFNKTQHLICI